MWAPPFPTPLLLLRGVNSDMVGRYVHMQCGYKTGQGISSLNDIVGFLST